MRSSAITLVGVALIVLSIVAFAYRGIPYTSREKVIDIGPLKASVDTRKTIPMSPLLIGLALVSGAALVAVGSMRSS
jgi:hypothetical protein